MTETHDEFDELTHYDVLQVSPSADQAVVDAAYRRLAQKYHPDVSSSADSTTLMAMINTAYRVLRDPARRAEYDDELRRREVEAPDLAAADAALEAGPALGHRTGEGPAASPRSTWRTRLGLVAAAAVVALLGIYLLTEEEPRSGDFRRQYATSVALSGAGSTAQPARDGADQAQAATGAVLAEPRSTAGGPETGLASRETADREARLAQLARPAAASPTTQAASAEATRAAFNAAAQQIEELQVARAAATSEALAALATREAESALARREAVAAEATAAETARQAAAEESARQALAAADAALEGRGRAAPVLPPPRPAPVNQRAVEQARACDDSQQIEVGSPLLQPVRQDGAVVYYGRAVVRNSCNYPIRIQLDFSATGADGRVLLSGLTPALLLAPGETRAIDEPIGSLPTHQIASFVVRPAVSEAP